MKKRELRIIRNDDLIVIKKKLDGYSCVIFAMVAASGIALPIVFESITKIWWFWVIYALCMGYNLCMFLFQFLGKIVVDLSKREISICNIYPERHPFNDVKEIKSFFEAGDSDGGMDKNKVVFVFYNGQRSEIHTTSKAQSEELIEILRSVLFEADGE